MEVSSAPPTSAVADTDTWARHALVSLAALPDVRRVGLALAEGGGRRLQFTTSDRLDPGATRAPIAWCHIDAYDRVPLNVAVRSGAPVHGDLTSLRPRFPEFVERQDRSTAALAAIPLHAAGQTLGAFVLFFGAEQPFDPPQIAALRGCGQEFGGLLRQARRGSGEASWEPGDAIVPPGALVALHTVRPDLAEARAARHFLETTLSAWGVDDEVCCTASLCLSELVTNALIHTHGGCRIRMLLEGDVLTVAVRDRGGASVHRPAPTPPSACEDPLEVHGRGLHVVEALASRWGSDVSDGGTTVWFVLDL